MRKAMQDRKTREMFKEYIDNCGEYRNDCDGYRDDQGIYYTLDDLWDDEKENFEDYVWEQATKC